MNVILLDLGKDMHDVMVSNTSWSETVAIIRTLAVLDEERLQRLASAWLGKEQSQRRRWPSWLQTFAGSA